MKLLEELYPDKQDLERAKSLWESIGQWEPLSESFPQIPDDMIQLWKKRIKENREWRETPEKWRGTDAMILHGIHHYIQKAQKGK